MAKTSKLLTRQRRATSRRRRAEKAYHKKPTIQRANRVRQTRAADRAATKALQDAGELRK